MATIFAEMALLYRPVGFADGGMCPTVVLGRPVSVLVGGVLAGVCLLVLMGDSGLAGFLVVPTTV